jgi:UDP-glucose 4-epimerase
MAHYLVTGGAGFIGSHLVDSLLQDGHTVRVLDDLSTGRRENLHDAVELIVADVVEPEAVRAGLDGIDACFHLAAIASVDYYRNDWLRAHAVNLRGTINMLNEIARLRTRLGCPLQLVYASSAAVYGDTATVPIAEDAPTRPINAYGADKLGCELQAAVAARIFGTRTVGLRLFNVYGPRQDPNSPYSGVISIFCRQISAGTPISIHGDGGQVRDFIYVEDVVRALRKAAGSAHQVFNVCTGKGTTIRQLAETIALVHEMPLHAVEASARLGDIRVSVGDPRRARDGIGFSARVGLQEGLAAMVRPDRRRASGAAVPVRCGAC